MSFAAKGKKCTKSRQTPQTVLQKLSPKPTCTPLNETLNWIKGVCVEKIDIFYRIDTPFADLWVSWPREKKLQNQDKHTPHTVLQKLSPKPTRTPLKEQFTGEVLYGTCCLINGNTKYATLRNSFLLLKRSKNFTTNFNPDLTVLKFLKILTYCLWWQTHKALLWYFDAKWCHKTSPIVRFG